MIASSNQVEAYRTDPRDEEPFLVLNLPPVMPYDDDADEDDDGHHPRPRQHHAEADDDADDDDDDHLIIIVGINTLKG